MSERKTHYNWDGFKTWCGRSIAPPLRATGFVIRVTCERCRKELKPRNLENHNHTENYRAESK
jgi:hypothetical protein